MRWLIFPFLLLQTFGGLQAQSIQVPSRDFKIDLSDSTRSDFKIDLRKLNQEALQRDFRFKFLNAREVANLDDFLLQSSTGKIVKDRKGADLHNEMYIVGTTNPASEISITSIGQKGRDVQISFAMQNRETGAFLDKIKRDEVIVFDKFGAEKCFEFDHIRNSEISISIGMAIDISASMRGYENETNKTVRAFMKKIPIQSQCSIAEFNHAYSYLIGGKNKSELCRRAHRFSISTPNGGTSIFPALEDVYKTVSAQKSDLNVVFVISDGQSDNNRFAEALAAKNDIPTFVNWLGSFSQAYDYPLSNFADSQVFGSVDENGSLSEFFDASTSMITDQFVATSCN